MKRLPCAQPIALRGAAQRGAALLVAMVILTLVSTLAAGMVWQQWRAVQVESAERARTQAAWLLAGALDWGRMVLREDRRTASDHLGEVWATPLAETRLSTFLAQDRDNNADAGPEAFLSGSIRDAQSRYNLRNLVVDGKVVEAELTVLKRLCESAAVPIETAELIANGLAAALQSASTDAATAAAAPLLPRVVGQLVWLGPDAQVIQRLAPFVELLPQGSGPTTLNLNTASREVLAAVVDGLDASSAERVVLARQRQPFDSIAAARAHLPADTKVERLGVNSKYFEIFGRLRLEGLVLEERALVERTPAGVVALLRERHSVRIDP
jgi:general secretion pathway protein K